MPQFDDEFRPDPKKITVRGGVFFNPWVNISACVVTTIGLGWLTLWLLSLYFEVTESAPYPDQSLDAVGTMIGVVFLGLAPCWGAPFSSSCGGLDGPATIARSRTTPAGRRDQVIAASTRMTIDPLGLHYLFDLRHSLTVCRRRRRASRFLR